MIGSTMGRLCAVILLCAMGRTVHLACAGCVDCNDNGIDDHCDIDCGPLGGSCDILGCGTGEDCDGNGVPDGCEPPGWQQAAELLPDDGASQDEFGRSVSVSGDAAVIGVRKDDDNGKSSGAAYVFRRNGATWGQEQKLLPNDGGPGDFFGSSVSVSVSGDVAVVGAYLDDDKGNASGSAYVFRWNGANWLQEDKLLPDDGAPGDGFGFTVSISGDVAVIGTPFDNGIGIESGSSYVFRWNGVTWMQEQKLVTLDGSSVDFFGYSVSVCGDVAVIGVPNDDDSGSNSGAAYVFRSNDGVWVQEQKLLADDGAEEDFFGIPPAW